MHQHDLKAVKSHGIRIEKILEYSLEYFENKYSDFVDDFDILSLSAGQCKILIQLDLLEIFSKEYNWDKHYKPAELKNKAKRFNKAIARNCTLQELWSSIKESDDFKRECKGHVIEVVKDWRNLVKAKNLAEKLLKAEINDDGIIVKAKVFKKHWQRLEDKFTRSRDTLNTYFEDEQLFYYTDGSLWKFEISFSKGKDKAWWLDVICVAENSSNSSSSFERDEEEIYAIGGRSAEQYLEYKEHPLGITRHRVNIKDIENKTAITIDEWDNLIEKIIKIERHMHFVHSPPAMGKTAFVAFYLKALIDKGQKCYVFDFKRIDGEGVLDKIRSIIVGKKKQDYCVVFEDAHLVDKFFTKDFLEEIRLADIGCLITFRSKHTVLKNVINIAGNVNWATVVSLPDYREYIIWSLYKQKFPQISSEYKTSIEEIVLGFFNYFCHSDLSLALVGLEYFSNFDDFENSYKAIVISLNNYIEHLCYNCEKGTRLQYLLEVMLLCNIFNLNGSSLDLDFLFDEKIFTWPARDILKDTVDYLISTGEYSLSLATGKGLIFERSSGVSRMLSYILLSGHTIDIERNIVFPKKAMLLLEDRENKSPIKMNQGWDLFLKLNALHIYYKYEYKRREPRAHQSSDCLFQSDV